MLYHLVKKHWGKEVVVKKRITASQRKGIKGQRVEYVITLAENINEKYKMPPHNLHLSGQPRRSGPPVIPKK